MKKLLLILVVFASLNAQATEYFSVGGGYAPAHSEVSLENNILNFLKLLPSPSIKQTYFASGNDKQICDVIENDPEISKYPDALLSLFYLGPSDASNIRVACRHNKIPALNGSATKNMILENLQKIAERRQAQKDISPFRFYFAGHGQAGEAYSKEKSKAYPQAKNRMKFNQNTLLLWKDDKITVQEFTKKLDLFPSKAPIQVLMPQCYAGGFSQINWQGGDLFGNLSSANRCGFFAQVEGRPSVGCSSKANENIYYSNYFFQAYEKFKKHDLEADYNHDGKIGSNEAHAYAVIHSSTIDVPRKTSDMLLYDVRQIIGNSILETSKTTPWKQIKSILEPEELAIVLSLSKKSKIDFSLESTPPSILLSERIDALNELFDSTEMSVDALLEDYDYSRYKFVEKIKNKYPVAFKHSTSVLNEDGRQRKIQAFKDAKDFVFKNEMASYEIVKSKHQRWKSGEEELNQLVKDEAILLRISTVINESLTRTAFNTVFKSFVPYQKYLKLKKCESEPFFIN